MVIQEHLMICLIEELAEMQQAASKCLRFGPYDVCKVENKENIKKVEDELSDVFAILAILGQVGVDIKADENKSKAKIHKTLDFMQHAISTGALEDPEETKKRIIS
jgi:hypothetical protein